MHFVKAYNTILLSSVWLEDASTRLVWITMLLLADHEGCVRASVRGLAHSARVEDSECERALAVLSAPDSDSRSKNNEGRRIEAFEGGWSLINYKQYREMRTSSQIATAERVKKHRERKRNATIVTGNDLPPEVEVELTTPPTVVREGFALDPPAKVGKRKGASAPRPPASACTDAEWQAVANAYEAARVKAGLPANWGPRDVPSNRKHAARIFAEGGTLEDLPIVLAHRADAMLAGDHPKWSALEHLSRHWEKERQAAYGGKAKRVWDGRGVMPVSDEYTHDEPTAEDLDEVTRRMREAQGTA